MTGEPSGQQRGVPPAGKLARRIAARVITQIRRNPVRNVAILLTALAALFGMGLVLINLPTTTSPNMRQPSGTLAEALAALDVDDRETARLIAADLRLVDDLPAEEAGGPAYILGVAMARDAEEQWEPGERRIRFLLATRYLEEAKQTGFPPDRRSDGLFVLGRALHDAGQFAESLPVLREALQHDFARRTEIQGLLADSYLRDAEPQYDKALEYNREYLSDDALTFDQRYGAMITKAEVLFRLSRLAECDAAATSIPSTSPHFAPALMIRGRLALAEGDQLAKRADTASQRAAAIEAYDRSRELLADAHQHAPSSLTISRQADYLTGLTFRKSGVLRPTDAERSIDLRAALERFSRTRRVHFNTVEGASSALEEAEVLQLLGDDDKAVVAFRLALQLVDDMPSYNNPWIALPELKQRIEAAYVTFLNNEAFEYAGRLASSMKAVFSESRSMQLQAEAREAAARELSERARDLPLSSAQPLLVDSRTEHRRAGALYARLAKLRFATREYPNDLWKCAQNYLFGQDYERAVRYLTQYLDTQTRNGRPPALTALGEAMLALHQPQKALPHLTECIEFFGRDPHSYRARIIAAQAHQELGDLQQARSLLEANLNHPTLTPRSLEWRESLFMLGELLYLQGVELEVKSRLEGISQDLPATRKKAVRLLESARDAFHDAIVRLGEAVQRDPNADQAIEARYRIAEAYRHSAKLPRRKLDYVTIDTTRKKLTEELNRELQAAETGYRNLIGLLDRKLERSELSGVESRILRNCYFGRADALYDMGRYEDAIQAYSDATNRYQQNPEALEAYVQIANCHRRQNRPAEARGTLEQAKVILNRIHPEADFLRTTRYDRDEWGKILDWMGTL